MVRKTLLCYPTSLSLERFDHVVVVWIVRRFIKAPGDLWTVSHLQIVERFIGQIEFTSACSHSLIWCPVVVNLCRRHCVPFCRVSAVRPNISIFERWSYQIIDFSLWAFKRHFPVWIYSLNGVIIGLTRLDILNCVSGILYGKILQHVVDRCLFISVVSGDVFAVNIESIAYGTINFCPMRHEAFTIIVSVRQCCRHYRFWISGNAEPVAFCAGSVALGGGNGPKGANPSGTADGGDFEVAVFIDIFTFGGKKKI